MSKRKRKPIILFVIALAALYVIIYIVPTVTGAMVSSYTIEYGQLKISDEVNGYLVRDEQVYTAATGGKANRYIESGTLVRSGTTVMEVSGGSDDEIDARYTELLTRLGNSGVSTDTFTTRKVGIISYYADGYEGKIRPDNMEQGNYSYYSKLSQDSVVNLQRDSVASGEPVFKVVDRTVWYIVCFVPAEHMDRYEKGDQITVEFADDYVEAQVYSVTEDPDGEHGRVILSTDNYYEKYIQTRVCQVSLVTYDQQGLLIENSSIAEKDGQQGVYVKDNNRNYSFVPIKIYATDGTYSLIADDYFIDKESGQQYDTVEIYDEVLKDPE